MVKLGIAAHLVTLQCLDKGEGGIVVSHLLSPSDFAVSSYGRSFISLFYMTRKMHQCSILTRIFMGWFSYVGKTCMYIQLYKLIETLFHVTNYTQAVTDSKIILWSICMNTCAGTILSVQTKLKKKMKLFFYKLPKKI